MQFTRQVTTTHPELDGSTTTVTSPLVIDLVNIEPKRTKKVDGLEAVVGKDGKPLLGPDGKPQMKVVKVAIDKDTYPFLSAQDQALENLVRIFGKDTIEKQLIALLKNTFQTMWFKDAEKDEKTFIGYLENESFGSVRERTIATITSEMIKCQKAGNFKGMLTLAQELNELTQELAAKTTNGQ